MYPVTTLFKEKVKETTRTWKTQVDIQHSGGVLTLYDEDLVSGTMRIEENSQSGQDFSIGGVVASNFEVTIKNKTDGITGTYVVDNLNIAVDDMLQDVDWYEEYNSINFEGATVIPQVALLVDEENGTWEYVPLGRYTIDEVTKSRNTIKIKAVDNMIELDKPYSLSKLGYPATLYQIYTNICNIADVQIGTTEFLNQGYVVDERPEGNYTLRDVLSFVAQLSGSFARFNRTGTLELVWYTDSGITLGPGNRFNFKPREDTIKISGASYDTTDDEGQDIAYLAGTDEYVVDLTDNPLLQNSFETVIAAIYDKVKDTAFTPYESSWQGNPAIQPGDKITQIDRDGNEYSTIVTYSAYKYRGAGTLAARGQPVKAKRYTGSTNKKIAEIKRKIEKEVGDKLTSLEQAQLNVTELIANMLGGYVIYGEDAIYIADNPDIDVAQKIWKWGIGGFGYSEDGVEGPYNTGVSADGTIVAMLVAAHIITADMIQTGILQSQDGSTWINLNNGSFNLKNILTFKDGLFTLNDPDVIKQSVAYNGTRITQQDGIRVNFDNGGHAQMGDGSILVQHADGSHTIIDGRGIMRQLSIPIFEDSPTDADIIETFESGALENTRVDMENSYAFGWGEAVGGWEDNKYEHIAITSSQKYSGTYSLSLHTKGATHGGHRGVSCAFLNYRPTKDTELTLKYKTVLTSDSVAYMRVKDMDTVYGEEISVSLDSSNWNTASISLSANVTYRLSIFLRNEDDEDTWNYVYIDDVMFEEDVNAPIIVGYEQSLQPYYDFTYVRKGHFDGNGQQQIILPDYFRGLNFDVFITPSTNWKWSTLDGGEYLGTTYYTIYPTSMTILAINNTIPSFTIEYSCDTSNTPADFLYTIILNQE